MSADACLSGQGSRRRENWQYFGIHHSGPNFVTRRPCLAACLFAACLPGALQVVSAPVLAHDSDQHRDSTPEAEFVDAFNEICLATSANIAKIRFKLSKPNPWHFKPTTSVVTQLPSRYVKPGLDIDSLHAVNEVAVGLKGSDDADPGPGSLRVLVAGPHLPGARDAGDGSPGNRQDDARDRSDNRAEEEFPDDGMPALPGHADIEARGEMVSLMRPKYRGARALYLGVRHREGNAALALRCRLTAFLPAENAARLKDEARDKLAVVAQYQDIAPDRRLWVRAIPQGGEVRLDLFPPDDGVRPVRLTLHISTQKNKSAY